MSLGQVSFRARRTCTTRRGVSPSTRTRRPVAATAPCRKRLLTQALRRADRHPGDVDFRMVVLSHSQHCEPTQRSGGHPFPPPQPVVTGARHIGLHRIGQFHRGCPWCHRRCRPHVSVRKCLAPLLHPVPCHQRLARHYHIAPTIRSSKPSLRTERDLIRARCTVLCGPRLWHLQLYTP